MLPPDPAVRPLKDSAAGVGGWGVRGEGGQGFVSHPQSVLSDMQELQSSNDTVSDHTHLWHFPSASSIFIVIRKILSQQQWSHAGKWNYRGPQRRHKLPMSRRKSPFALEAGFETCIHILL